jgi:hypothetical protein
MWTSQYIRKTSLSKKYFEYVEKINHEILKTLDDTNNTVIYNFILFKYTIIIIIIIIDFISSFRTIHTEQQ